MNTPVALRVLNVLEEEVQQYNVPIMDLYETHEDDPFRILVGTILSARTKDETTAVVCQRLFKKAKNPQELQRLSVKEIERLIFPVGFYKTKARHLKELANILVAREIPQTIQELMTLPGVGPKTANLVVSLAFNKDGLCVDTHVHRIMNRLGFIRTRTPLESEVRLKKKLPKSYWRLVNRVLVAYGQNTCTPISPYCSRCPIKDLCEQKGVVSKR